MHALAPASCPSCLERMTGLALQPDHRSRADCFCRRRQERGRWRLTALAGHEGLVLVTGPTGSDTATILYAALQRVHRRILNIVTSSSCACSANRSALSHSLSKRADCIERGR